MTAVGFRPAGEAPLPPPPVTVDRRRVEDLARKIGAHLDFDVLDVILFKLSGKAIIQEIANPRDPQAYIARMCIERTEADGTLVHFLALVVEALPEEAPLRDYIRELVPEVRDARPVVRPAVDRVVRDLYRVKALSADPMIREAVTRSREALRRHVGSVRALKAYKTMHDALHTLLIRDFNDVNDDARRIADDSDALGRLRYFHANVRFCHTQAMSALRDLPEEGHDRTIERYWIDQLDTLADALEIALDDRSPGQAALHAGRLTTLIEKTPFQLNTKIFASAQEMDLASLVDALELIDAAAAGAHDFSGAIEALEGLRVTLMARVSEHTLWQRADDEFSELDRTFELPRDHKLKGFILLWPEVRRTIYGLARSAAGADWARRILTAIERVDDQLAVVDAARSEPGAAEPLEDLQRRLADRYRSLRQKVRIQSFLVDTALKDDSADLVDIGAPVAELLEELARP